MEEKELHYPKILDTIFPSPIDTSKLSFKDAIDNIVIENTIPSYLNHMMNNFDNSVVLSNSISQLQDFRGLLEVANKNNKPIMFIVRNDNIKKVLTNIAKQINDVGDYIYIETVDEITENGIYINNIKNGIISFFDIPNLGKKIEIERKLIEHIQTNIDGVKLLFTNFSDKFKSNTNLRDTVKNGILIDDNGTNTKQLNDSDKHGTLNIEEVKLDQEQKNNDYDSLFEKYLEKSNNNHFIGLIDSSENARKIIEKYEDNKKIVHITNNNILDFYLKKDSIENYDLVLLEDDFVGFLDISNASGAIFFDYQSEDKTRKIAKQLIFNQPCNKKTLIYSRIMKAWYEQDTPKSNLFGINDSISKIFPRSKGKRKSEEKVPKSPVEKLTPPLEFVLGLDTKSNLKRLDYKELIKRLKPKISELQINNIGWFNKTNIKEVRKTFNKIPEFQEIVKKTKRTNTNLMTKAHFINLLKEIGLLSEEDIKSYKKEFLKYIGLYSKKKQDDTLDIAKKAFGENYKENLINLAKKQLKSFGIENYYDLLFYTYKIAEKPKHLNLKNFNSSNNGDQTSIAEQLRKHNFLNLVIFLFLEDINPSNIKREKLKNLGVLIYGNDVENKHRPEFMGTLNLEIKKYGDNQGFIRLGVSSIRKKAKDMPYFNLFCKINGVKMSSITNDELKEILSLLDSEK